MTENYAMSLQDGAAETQQTHHTGMKITPLQLKGPVLCKTSHLRRVFQSRVRSALIRNERSPPDNSAARSNFFFF